MAVNRQHYNFLCQHYSKSILESKLMLDEDMEVIQCDYYNENSSDYSYRPSLFFTVGTTLSLGFTILSKRIGFNVLLVPSILFATFTLVYEVSEILRNKRQRSNINNLIDALKNIRYLNNNVAHFVKLRHEIKENGPCKFFEAITPQVHSLVCFVNKNETEVLHKIKHFLLQLSKLEESLEDDVSIIHEVILDNDIGCEMESIVLMESLQRLQAIYVLFISKLLSYICIVLNRPVQEYEFKKLVFNYIVPELLCDIETCHNSIKSKFELVKYSKERVRKNYKDMNKLTNHLAKSMSNRMQQTLVYSTSNLSIILEKSETLLNSMEGRTDEDDLSDIAPSIEDLKKHTYSTYETLDILCKFFDVYNSKRTRKHDLESPINLVKKVENSINLTTIKYDDIIQPNEEEYELEMKNEEQTVDNFTGEYHDDNGKCMGLMIQEMKQALKKHQRFIDAKKRRGSVDEQPKLKPIKESEEPIPKFDLNEKVEKIFDAKHSKIPEPPPFPIPSFIDIEEGGKMTSMLDSIKLLSNQIDIKEDYFGDDSMESSDSEY
ncbi:unnamed protein product [Brassicogethes aeneus]|uniref:Vezatin n=1 Tax=Brassicogethes aeneus TaxID=1431903 RepID=A0A9P0B3C4_BRAAE|nr:unnamed protein product [Brassicogethes aeneus]